MRLSQKCISLALVGYVFVIFMVGCRNTTPPPPAQNSAPPTVASFFSQIDTPTPRPSPTLLPTIHRPTPDLTPSQIITATVYSDFFDVSWTWLETPDMEIDPAASKYVHGGRKSIAITPTKDFGALYFAVRPESQAVYLRDELLGISLWLSSGDGIVAPDDLAIAVVGSNAYPFWAAGDDSVEVDDSVFFSETRLYYLNVDRSIPPQTWVKLEVWLDDLPYDPDYQYVTGFYIKNDKGFFQTVYVDDVQLLMLSDNE